MSILLIKHSKIFLHRCFWVALSSWSFTASYTCPLSGSIVHTTVLWRHRAMSHCNMGFSLKSPAFHLPFHFFPSLWNGARSARLRATRGLMPQWRHALAPNDLMGKSDKSGFLWFCSQIASYQWMVMHIIFWSWSSHYCLFSSPTDWAVSNWISSNLSKISSIAMLSERF